MGLFDAIIGSSATGSKLQEIPVPPSRYQQATTTYSGLPHMTGVAGNVISSQMAGQLSPAQMAQLQDQNAQWGVQSGMPMSGASQNRWDTSRVNATGALQNLGLQNFGNFQSGLEAGMNDPELLADISQWNDVVRNSPDPEMVAWADAGNSLINGVAGYFGAKDLAGKTEAGQTGQPTYSGFGRSPMQSALGGGYPSVGAGSNWQDYLGNDYGNELGIGIGGGGTGMAGFL
jgi:hypothetical protein